MRVFEEETNNDHKREQIIARKMAVYVNKNNKTFHSMFFAIDWVKMKLDG